METATACLSAGVPLRKGPKSMSWGQHEHKHNIEKGWKIFTGMTMSSFWTAVETSLSAIRMYVSVYRWIQCYLC